MLMTPALLSAQQAVIINEFMSANSETLEDNDGDFSDWIELYNSGSDPVDLFGWTLTDDEEDPAQWTFPHATLQPGSYLIVYASGKDRADPVSPLHTNFKINKDGEYLALFDNDGNAASLIETFEEVGDDISYNYSEGEYLKSDTPTPWEPNTITWQVFVDQPEFNVPHGFYDSNFELEINTSVPSAEIYYTTDGSRPGLNNGTLYTEPLSITTTSVVRAVTVFEGSESRINTVTYLFTEDIIEQPENPEGYPQVWGQFYESEGTAPADYGMDRELTRNITYKDQLEDALLTLPVLSIVMDKDDLFSHVQDPDSGGIYIFTGNYGSDPGKGWERPASIELFNDDEVGLDFQENVGIELHGGASRLAEKTPKHSFRLSFKPEYGPSRLNYPVFGPQAGDSYNSVVLRAGYGNSWLHRSSNERNYALLIRDLWAKDTQQDMGHQAGHGRYFHLYLNGMYWGIYNPTERMNLEFAVRYFGGKESDYDILKDYGELVEGSKTAWNEMVNLMEFDLSSDANYFRLLGRNPDGSDNLDLASYIDIENFIDYMIIHYYGANWDWDHHNWVAMRNRVNPGKGFMFFSWDSEHVLEEIDDYNLDYNYENRPTFFFNQLIANDHFRDLFANRVQKHFYNGGALTPEAGIKRLMKRAQQIEMAIISESQRWGDYRRDVHSDYPSGPFELYTKDHWLEQLDYLTEEYFPERGDVFIEQLREEGWFPMYDAPVFMINGQANVNTFSSGDSLTMTPDYGDIFYTLDGSDPMENNKPSATAIEYDKDDPLILSSLTQIKARTFARDEWSALSEQTFVSLENYESLKLTEIHYHPLGEDTVDDKNFEFLELKNTGDSPVQLAGLLFTEGVSYSFPEFELQPDGFTVIASDSTHFRSRYGFAPFGQFEGAIDNSGERIMLGTVNNDTLINIRYNDKSPWPESADGDGFSLVPVDPNPTGDQNNSEFWRASAEVHGSPGEDDPAPSTSTEENNPVPETFTLNQNYPNPFNPMTIIGYEVPFSSSVEIKVFNMVGREIAVLVDGWVTAGSHQVTFDGSGLASGVYFYQLQTQDFTTVRRMLLIK
jgi:hypothetical protein